MRRLLAAAVLLVVAAPTARAACTALTGGVVPYPLSNNAGAVTIATQATTTADATVPGAVAFDTAANVLKVCTGTSWESLVVGTGTLAAGGTGQVQFNGGSGALAADAALYWDDANKRLGIGRVPSYALDVNGTLGTIGAANGVIAFSGTAQSFGKFYHIENGGGMGTTWIYTQGAQGDTAFYNNGAERMRIQANGNVGIGTTNPGFQLHVVGTDVGFNFTGNGMLRFTSDAAANYIQSAPNVPNLHDFRKLIFGGWASTSAVKMVIDSNGNVGVGTATPESKLNVSATGPDAIRLDGNTAGAPIAVAAYLHLNSNIDYRGRGMLLTTNAAEAGAAWFAGVPYNGGRFIIGNSDVHTREDLGGPYTIAKAKMTILPNGNVGIGTTAPATTLDVSGFMKLAKNIAAPATCNGTYDGAVALTSARRMCVCDGTSWKEVNSATACVW